MSEGFLNFLLAFSTFGGGNADIRLNTIIDSVFTFFFIKFCSDHPHAYCIVDSQVR